MTFAQWAGLPLADGEHAFDELPLDALHPLRHGRVGVRLEVVRGTVRACHFDVHANHRGDEKLLEVRDLRQGLALLNRHGWLTAPYAETLFARIAETMLGIAISPRASALRGLALAVNNAAVAAYWEHLDASITGQSSTALARREALLGDLERLTGARMHVTYVRIGGVAADIDDAQCAALRRSTDTEIAAAATAVAQAEGPLHVALPKSLRLPQGDAYEELITPHGTLGMWVFSRGGKVPHRVHLRTPGFAALARLEREAVGMAVSEFFVRLARTRLVLGEVAR